MLCSQCGKENDKRRKFCAQCGAPLRQDSGIVQNHSFGKTISSGAYAGDFSARSDNGSSASHFFKYGLNRRKKGLILGILILIMILIAGINVALIWFGSVNVDVANEYQMANNDGSVYETNSFIYYTTDDGLFRADKSSQEATRLTNTDITLITGSEDRVYYSDQEGTIYEIADRELEPEELSTNYNNAVNQVFLKDRYIYRLSSGILRKELHSERKGVYETILYEAEAGETVNKAVLYGEFIYMSVENSSGMPRLMRISLSDGEKMTLSEDFIEDFALSKDSVVYLTVDGKFFRTDLDGNNAEKYTQVNAGSAFRVFCSGDYVYYYDSDQLCRFGLDGGTATELEKTDYGDIGGIISSLVSIERYGRDLFVYNSDARKIAEIRP